MLTSNEHYFNFNGNNSKINAYGRYIWHYSLVEHIHFI